MPKVIKKRVIKKKVTPDDEVKSELLKFKETIKERRSYIKKIAIITLSLLVVITGAIFYYMNKSRKAERLFNEGYSLFYADYIKKPLSDQERYTKAIRLLSDSYRLNPNPLTLLYLADSYYRAGLYDNTIKTLDEFRKRYSQNRYLMPLYFQKLALVYKKMGRLDDALKVYDEMYKEGYTLRDLALKESVDILNSLGKKEDSQKRIELMKKEFPESPFIQRE